MRLMDYTHSQPVRDLLQVIRKGDVSIFFERNGGAAWFYIHCRDGTNIAIGRWCHADALTSYMTGDADVWLSTRQRKAIFNACRDRHNTTFLRKKDDEYSARRDKIKRAVRGDAYV